jgi:hypothetical protein
MKLLSTEIINSIEDYKRSPFNEDAAHFLEEHGEEIITIISKYEAMQTALFKIRAYYGDAEYVRQISQNATS